ncbi:branched-chain amino acid transport system II carrier protein [Spongiimicrobium salis]|uniref:branched-chain amino acid transport system II carrier protein n=1 Tax=Spongiimicrobium salis TaxID=1667022 RepID=UPI00374DD57F
MNKNKEVFVIAFALFSLFFGAGNLILPPLLGLKSGNLWWLVTLGFCVSAVAIPILGIMAHAKLQGTIFNFGEKVSSGFSLVYSMIIYIISISLPSPRTASTTHEMAVQPFLNSAPIYTSLVFFGLVYIFVMNRSKILNILGKILTPAIIIILLSIIGITVFSDLPSFGETIFKNPFTDGILEGYQTFDAIGAVVVGGVIIVSINLKGEHTYEEKRSLIRKAGLIAGSGLFIIYTGLIVAGALMHQSFDTSISRTALLNGISIKTLGNTASFFLSVLVSLACFTTAVGIVAGAADFIKSRYNNSQKAYTITAIVGCLAGVIMGQFNVGYIIAVALPALMFIYPITIVLILLNVLPDKFTPPTVFKIVVLTTVIFSIPDFLGSIGFGDKIASLAAYIPLSDASMGWVLPALLVFAFMNLKTMFTATRA